MIRAVPSISIHPRRVAFYLAAEESFFPFPPAVTHPSIHRLYSTLQPAARPAGDEREKGSVAAVRE
jgi:hypothetical protein